MIQSNSLVSKDCARSLSATDPSFLLTVTQHWPLLSLLLLEMWLPIVDCSQVYFTLLWWTAAKQFPLASFSGKCAHLRCHIFSGCLAVPSKFMICSRYFNQLSSSTYQVTCLAARRPKKMWSVLESELSCGLRSGPNMFVGSTDLIKVSINTQIFSFFQS